MKWHWKEKAVNFVKMNQNEVENVDMSEFESLLKLEEEEKELDKLFRTMENVH